MVPNCFGLAIGAKLGDPDTDPLGRPIPELSGAIVLRHEVPLL
jgi:hypothetical protein